MQTILFFQGEIQCTELRGEIFSARIPYGNGPDGMIRLLPIEADASADRDYRAGCVLFAVGGNRVVAGSAFSGSAKVNGTAVYLKKA